jgi:hypothetical protein
VKGKMEEERKAAMLQILRRRIRVLKKIRKKRF